MNPEMQKRQSVLVAVDFSAESREALRAARSLASATGSSLTVAHVRPFSDIRKAIAEHYGERLAGMIREGREERLAMLRGKPSFELCREAGRNHDFLVMGSRGRGGVASTLLGSTVQEVLTFCTVPVLVIPARAAGAGQRRKAASKNRT